MPTDNRRLPVPEESRPPQTYISSSERDIKVVTESGERHDGRQTSEMRPIFLKAGVVSQARGSAYLELDKTKIICAVYGPREVTKREEFSMKGQLNCEVKFATFSCRQRRQHTQDNDEKAMSVVLEQALEPAVCMEKFPKARMDVFVTILEDDGSALAAVITCASLALSDGGVEMFDLVIGCSLRQLGKWILLDPCADEEFKPKLSEPTQNNAGLTVGYLPSLQQISALVQSGDMELSMAQQGIKLCVSTCQRIYTIVQQCLICGVKNKVKDKT